MSPESMVLHLSGSDDDVLQGAPNLLLNNSPELDIIVVHKVIRDIGEFTTRIARANTKHKNRRTNINGIVDEFLPELWPSLEGAAQLAWKSIDAGYPIELDRYNAVRKLGIKPHIDEGLIGVTASLGLSGKAKFFVERDPTRQYGYQKPVPKELLAIRSIVKQEPGDLVLFMNYPQNSLHAINAGKGRRALVLGVRKRN
jgi:hypothetical protein